LSSSKASKGKKRQGSTQKRKKTKKARYSSGLESALSLSKSDLLFCKAIWADLKKFEKKITKKLEKVFRETRKIMEKMMPTCNKYKNMLVNMDLIKDQSLRDGWDRLQYIGSMKEDLGRHAVPCRFQENLFGNFFKFLEFQQEHGHGVVPADVEHKSLSNWLKNQRNDMRDYKNKMGDNITPITLTTMN
jgi:hypothetical protein